MASLTKDFFYLKATMTHLGLNKYIVTKKIDVIQPCSSAYPKTVSNVSLAPNPADDDLNLTYDSTIDDSGRLTILSSSGVVFQTNALKMQRGSNTYNIALQNIPSGIYYVQFTTSSSTIVLSFVKN